MKTSIDASVKFTFILSEIPERPVQKEKKTRAAAEAKAAGKRLVDLSKKDKVWDIKKDQCDSVASIYASEVDFERYAQNIHDCGGHLEFGKDAITGLFELLVAWFCRNRHCPICQWRRSKMWRARFKKELPNIIALHPTARWIFLTITIRNCPIDELSSTLTLTNKGWQRLVQRKVFKGAVLGWLRSTEVTARKEQTAHPHFHTLVMVKPSYFKNNYISQAQWTELWKSCAKLDYDPIVYVQTVKSKNKGEESSDPTAGVLETLKYSVKPDDMIKNPEWFLELTRQLKGKRFIASGGVLKNILKEEEETAEDLLLRKNEEASLGGETMKFGWHRKIKHYVKVRDGQDVD